jgi:hypothetical protein
MVKKELEVCCRVESRDPGSGARSIKDNNAQQGAVDVIMHLSPL